MTITLQNKIFINCHYLPFTKQKTLT